MIGIEINGIYWHMSPNIYEANDINPTTKETAQEVWSRDNLKKELCRNKGIEMITIWEDEWEENKDYLIKYMLEKIS
jgi:hypothetical protein